MAALPCEKSHENSVEVLRKCLPMWIDDNVIDDHLAQNCGHIGKTLLSICETNGLCGSPPSIPDLLNLQLSLAKAVNKKAKPDLDAYNRANEMIAQDELNHMEMIEVMKGQK